MKGGQDDTYSIDQLYRAVVPVMRNLAVEGRARQEGDARSVESPRIFRSTEIRRLEERLSLFSVTVTTRYLGL